MGQDIRTGGVGLGIMGGPMAANPVTAGFDLTGCHRTPAAVDRLMAAAGKSTRWRPRSWSAANPAYSSGRCRYCTRWVRRAPVAVIRVPHSCGGGGGGGFMQDPHSWMQGPWQLIHCSYGTSFGSGQLLSQAL